MLNSDLQEEARLSPVDEKEDRFAIPESVAALLDISDPNEHLEIVCWWLISGINSLWGGLGSVCRSTVQWLNLTCDTIEYV